LIERRVLSSSRASGMCQSTLLERRGNVGGQP
jgi:hypothetical protein